MITYISILELVDILHVDVEIVEVTVISRLLVDFELYITVVVFIVRS